MKNIRSTNKTQSDGRFFFTSLATVACILIVITVVISVPSLFATEADSTDNHIPPQSTTDPSTKTDNEVSSAISDDSSDDSVQVTDTDAPADTTDAVSSPPEQPIVSCLLPETADAGQDYLDKIVFLGDSTTYSFLYYGKLSGGTSSTQVWTPASRTLTLDHALTTTILYPETDEEILLSEALALKKPEILVITLGVNGISYMEEEYFTSVYTKLIGLVQTNSPDTKIILQSIFPVATNWEKTTSINNEKIIRANGWIQNVADSCAVRYLDTISVLAVDEEGYLPQSYQNGDGLHLSPDACDIVLQYIRTHALPEYVPQS